MWRFVHFLVFVSMIAVASNTGADNLRVERELEMDAPIEQVWAMWTTEEGLRQFMSDHVHIEIEPGGAWEFLFDMDVPEGLRGSEGCRILALDPPHMLSFTWNAPPSFGDLRDHQTHVTVRLAEIPGSRTRLRFVHEGFGESARWREIHRYFERAWGDVVLPRLSAHFEGRSGADHP